MRDNKEIHKLYWLWLCNIGRVGRACIERLLEEFETPENIYKQEKVEWFTDAMSESFANSKKEKWLKIYKGIYEKGIKIITVDDEEYPRRLECLADKPYILYVKGNLPSEKMPTCGIVGARNCTRYGAEFARAIGAVLAENGIQVISGMARGIDCESQKGALEAGGSSFGILGTGVDICYPRENIRVYEKLQQNGGVISELFPGTPGNPGFFPMRNRIISALSDKLVVVEAKEKSGSLITVDFALEQGKDVFGLPGRITDELSKGVNNILKQGAGMLTKPEDILDEYEISHGGRVAYLDKTKILLAEREKLVYSKLDLEAKNLQLIIEETGFTIPELSDALLELQMKGLVVECGKNYYARSKI
ncbi:MAG: DNA-processing protein DprA [Lachnospiraceae bacterium]|nr:DNA-processing protein DprA [Lachnospiraceae bacterium]